MRIFITGATGFIGGEVARLLRERGDQVRALVREPARARALSELGCETWAGELSDPDALTRGMEGMDATIHAAAVYEIGIAPRRRPAMHATNVEGTRNVVRAAARAGVGRLVYVSTVAIYGNTRGRVVDEDFVRDQPYTSCYERTKHLAHVEARRLAEELALPLVTVQPGGVYGPRDTSALGVLVRSFLAGQMPVLVFPDFGLNLVHRDDVATGIVSALTRADPGGSYVLGAQVSTLREAVHTLARVSGRSSPRLSVPSVIPRVLAAPAALLRPLGFVPDVTELVSSSDGVTFWASHARAERELGHRGRDLETGFTDMLRAEGAI
ncbi:MAG: NAD-dependent epimerase/dehydratase family protein [Candidatus Dormibacteria bacterium]